MTRADIVITLGKMLTVNQKEAEAVKEAIKIILDSDWCEIEAELPPSMDFVLALVTGTVNGIRCEHAPVVASFAPDDGWMLVHVPDQPGDRWKVEAWKPIKYLEGEE